ncbi:hypothetical protein OROGR_025724 [Orobanche gracilis]
MDDQSHPTATNLARHHHRRLRRAHMDWRRNRLSSSSPHVVFHTGCRRLPHHAAVVFPRRNILPSSSALPPRRPPSP